MVVEATVVDHKILRQFYNRRRAGNVLEYHHRLLRNKSFKDPEEEKPVRAQAMQVHSNLSLSLELCFPQFSPGLQSVL